ncbi:MAG: symmetrical bis(5'-nucleosyl)-tetraphosphatase [Pseudomonadota bacterium]
MSTYAVGDIQGCLKPLQALLHHTGFDPSKDKLWLAGDLVNRGPDSLKTLRFLYHLRHSLTVVLGNHDLHLLAVAAGYRTSTPTDTLSAILEAPDRDILLEWLRHQALLHHDPVLNYTMVHAGIPPQWSLQKAIRYAQEVETVLRSNDINDFLESMYGNQPDIWNKYLKGKQRWRIITNYFTRMRFCTPSGRLELNAKAGIDTAPPGYLPWFAHTERKTKDDRIIFGHWAALEGNTGQQNVFAMDTKKPANAGFLHPAKINCLYIPKALFIAFFNVPAFSGLFKKAKPWSIACCLISSL